MLYRSICSKRVITKPASFIHTFSAARSIVAAAVSPQEKTTTRSNLNVIDFFHPSLSSSPLFHYTLNFGVSGYPKRGKSIDPTEGQQAIYSSVQVGDDAYFKRNDALGVADGVGGWRTHKGKMHISSYG